MVLWFLKPEFDNRMRTLTKYYGMLPVYSWHYVRTSQRPDSISMGNINIFCKPVTRLQLDNHNNSDKYDGNVLHFIRSK